MRMTCSFNKLKFRHVFVAALVSAVAACSGGRPASSPGLIADFTGTSPVEYYDIGFTRLALGDEKGAEEAFKTSLKTAARNGLDFAPPHEGMARLLLRKGKLDDARVEAEHALELDSHWIRTYWVLGKLADREGHEALALSHYERALIYAPGDPEITEAAAELLMRLNRGDEAREITARGEALRARPGSRGPGGAPAPAGTPGEKAPVPAPDGPGPAAPAPTAIQRMIEPFFPKTLAGLSPKVLAVFDQPHLTRGALAILAVGDGEHVLARAFDRSVEPDEEVLGGPRDIPGRPEARWVNRALALGLMEPLPDGTFRPDEPLSRLTLALWIEETIARLRHEQQVFEIYRGQKSPFSDLPDGHYGLNAARIATELNLLKPAADGRFNPAELVGMAEGVESLRKLAPALMGGE